MRPFQSGCGSVNRVIVVGRYVSGSCSKVDLTQEQRKLYAKEDKLKQMIITRKDNSRYWKSNDKEEGKTTGVSVEKKMIKPKAAFNDKVNAQRKL